MQAKRRDIKRKRTGCLTCRERRVRCGEERPICKNCSRKSRLCNWPKDGDRFRHHSFSSQSQSDNGHIISDEQNIDKLKHIWQVQPRVTTSLSPTAQDGTLQLPTPSDSITSPLDIIDGNHGGTTQRVNRISLAQKGRSYSTQSASSIGSLSADELSCWRSEVLQNYNNASSSPNVDVASYICRSQSARLRDIIDWEHESTIPPNLEPNAETFSSWQALGASQIVVDSLAGDKEMLLLQTYLQECAQWFDAVDGQRHYARKNVTRMMSCPPWRAAALAVSAKHLELTQKNSQPAESLSLHLYQLAVQLAIDSISGRFDCVGTTAGCVVLAVYEMMTVTYHDWRRHLQGCTSIYLHNRWNGDSMGLIRASFWNYARIGKFRIDSCGHADVATDIWAAFCSGTETMLPTDRYFNYPHHILQKPEVDEDQHARVAVWLLARVNNLIYCTSKTASDSIQSLRSDLEKWQKFSPPSSRPIMQLTPRPNAQAENPFPELLFAHDGSAIAYMMFLTAKILLLDYAAIKLGEVVDETAVRDMTCTVCGIVETQKQSSTVLVESIHPLWISGQKLKARAERFAVLELLARVERVIGWKTAWRAASLHDVWSRG